jgi:hypothetical protein
MKKLLMAFVVAASFAPVAVPANGQGTDEGSATANVEFCKLFNADTGVAVGRCVGFTRTEDLGSAGFATHFCQGFEGGDPEEFYQLYDSLSDCIRELHSEL